MAYSTQSDLENFWGSDNIAAWSDLTGGKTADTTRIAAAIAYADKKIDNRFRRQSRYEVPFTTGTDGTYDDQLIDWSAGLAGDWLYRSRQVRRRVRDGEGDEGLTSSTVSRINTEIAAAVSNQIMLDASEKGSPMPDSPTLVF